MPSFATAAGFSFRQESCKAGGSPGAFGIKDDLENAGGVQANEPVVVNEPDLEPHAARTGPDRVGGSELPQGECPMNDVGKG